ncbi:hypothetical protein DLR69_15790 [Vibrio paracholerae]|uniref:Uncharacterized protein n=1 Tax=Vibrio paracholerae TaxID=650003 RepID=A0ABX9FFN6_9VIBR|nr:hypothetical protein DLR69_15790 [Vibrio paracholerae]
MCSIPIESRIASLFFFIFHFVGIIWLDKAENHSLLLHHKRYTRVSMQGKVVKLSGFSMQLSKQHLALNIEEIRKLLSISFYPCIVCLAFCLEIFIP